MDSLHFMNDCLQFKEEDRSTIEKLVLHNYFSGCGKSISSSTSSHFAGLSRLSFGSDISKFVSMKLNRKIVLNIKDPNSVKKIERKI
jgi:hypothetical protein